MSIKVPLLDLSPQYLPLRKKILRSIEKVCDSQKFILGEQIEQLEQSVASYCHAKYGIAVSSGTDALLVSLMVLNIGQNDEVITTPYTFFATGGCISRVGATPVFCDIENRTYNISIDSICEFIKKRCKLKSGRLINKKSGRIVKAVIPVYLYGQTTDIDALKQIGKEYRLKLIEDAAQAIGAKDDAGNYAGSSGDIGCISFFPSKNLGCFGDGGMCLTNDSRTAEKLKIFRAHGSKPKYIHRFIGGNFRLDALQAAILLEKLLMLDEWTQQRIKNAELYNNLFKNATDHAVSTPFIVAGYRHVFNQYVIRVKRRDELRKYLTENGVGTEVYYPLPLHAQKCFGYLGYKKSDCPEALRASKETIALPVYPGLQKEQIEYVANKVISFYQ